METYTKRNLVEDLALHSGILGNTNAESSRVIEFIMETIKDNVAAGKKVDISGLCNFTPAIQKGKTGIVPKSNPPKKYTTQDKPVVKIKPSQAFKDQMSGKVKA